VDKAAAPRKRFDPVAYLKLFRFPLVFTAIADSAAGYLLATKDDLRASTFALLTVASAGLYFFGMALNDIADRERDKVLAPTRVLPSGRLTLRAAVFAAVLAVIGSLVAILATGGTPVGERFLLWILVVVSIVAYDKFLKFPPVMGLVRGFNLLLGVSAALPISEIWNNNGWVLGLAALPSLVYVSALTYISTLEDSQVDRVKVFVGAAFMALGALLAAVGVRLLVGKGLTGLWDYLLVDMSTHWHGLLFATTLTAWLCRRAWGARDKKSIMLLIRDGVGGIIFLDAALLGSFQGLLPALCVAALVIPAAISVAIFKRLA
jgi:4-hydroxybenzoate polyprenyltransferase